MPVEPNVVFSARNDRSYALVLQSAPDQGRAREMLLNPSREYLEGL